ncbi:MAG: hypothetical protein HFH85_20690 [Lachnospiraceae bacterium]|nr:hypothetical protein [Lachnospiraceae bacterium]HBA46391.1 hypothetical protein [Lachnospiraceae bacterium]
MVDVLYLAESCRNPDKMQEEVSSILKVRGMDCSWVVCSSMQAMEYEIFKKKDAVALINERSSAGENYGPWDIAGLRDIQQVRVIACVDRIRYGTSYMAVLYAGGITDALYEDDLDSRKIADLIQTGRSRSQSRKYYGLTSMEEVISVLQVMDRESLQRYIRYIAAGIDKEDMVARYQEVTKRLGSVEKCCLTKNIPEEILEEIGGTVIPEKLKLLRAEKKGRFRIF